MASAWSHDAQSADRFARRSFLAAAGISLAHCLVSPRGERRWLTSPAMAADARREAPPRRLRQELAEWTRAGFGRDLRAVPPVLEPLDASDRLSQAFAEAEFWLALAFAQTSLIRDAFQGETVVDFKKQAEFYQASVGEQHRLLGETRLADEDHQLVYRAALGTLKPYSSFLRRLAWLHADGSLRSTLWPSYYDRGHSVMEHGLSRLEAGAQGKSDADLAMNFRFWLKELACQAEFLGQSLDPRSKATKRSFAIFSRDFLALSRSAMNPAVSQRAFARAEAFAAASKKTYAGLVAGRVGGIFPPEAFSIASREAVKFLTESLDA